MPASSGSEDEPGERPGISHGHTDAAGLAAWSADVPAGAAAAAVPSGAASGGEVPTDQEIQQGVSKAYATLRKEYSIQQRQWAAEQLASCAERRRLVLARRAAARAALDAPTAVVLQAAGGLPLASQRGVGAAPFEQARAEVESLQAQRQQQRRRQGQHDAAGEASQAGPASRQQMPGHAQQQGVAGDAGSDMEAASDAEQLDDPMDVDGPAHWQPTAAPAAAAAAAGGRGRLQSAATPANASSQRPVPALPLATARGAQNIVGGKPELLQALVLPTLPGVPFYKAWSWLRRNVLSLETGKRQFYTDEKGETVPVSDDEADGDAQLEQRELLGRHRDKYDHILRGVVAQFGTGPAVFDTLHERLHISATALEQRAAVLAVEAAGMLQQQPAGWESKQDLSLLDEDMHSSWCRMCRTFACRIHRGGHVRPVLGPMHAHEEPRRVGEPKPVGNQPCGRECYLLQPGQAAEQQAAGGQQQQQQQEQQQAQQQAPQVQQAQQQEPLHQQLHRQQLDADEPDALSLGSSPGGGGWQRQQPRPRQAGMQGRSRLAAGGQQAGDQSPLQRAPEQEVTSPPSKLPLQQDGGPPAVQQPSAGAAAAAAVAAAANVPLRRRRSGGSAGSGSGGVASSSGAAREQEEVIALLDSSDTEPTGAGGAADAASQPWSAWEDALLQQGLEVWGREPCKIATLVGSRTCRQVHERMQELAGPSGELGAEGQVGEEGQQRRGKGRKQAKTQFKRPPAVAERAKRRTDQMWPQYFPCGCTGVCRSDCPCTKDANFCEKFCGCDPAKCGNRFPGCVCKSVGRRCASKLCPCLAAGRECDPDLCKMCKPTIMGEHQEGMQCHNFRLRLGQKKRVLMGLSDIQGWGAFLQQPAGKDEFVGEYCGELINHEEADRRGTVYDRDDNSYLFNLNLEWVIDARQQGNTLRFANHSTSANCRAEILMVDGDHRVAIVANREIRQGEELFYNYRYDKRVAPDWAAGGREEGERPRVAQKQGTKRQGNRSGGGGGGAGGSGGSDRD